MARWSLSVSVRCAGCGSERGLDRLRGTGVRLIMSADGVQVREVEEEARCPQCGDRRVVVRWGGDHRTVRAAARN